MLQVALYLAKKNSLKTAGQKTTGDKVNVPKKGAAKPKKEKKPPVIKDAAKPKVNHYRALKISPFLFMVGRISYCYQYLKIVLFLSSIGYIVDSACRVSPVCTYRFYSVGCDRQAPAKKVTSKEGGKEKPGRDGLRVVCGACGQVGFAPSKHVAYQNTGLKWISLLYLNRRAVLVADPRTQKYLRNTNSHRKLIISKPVTDEEQIAF